MLCRTYLIILQQVTETSAATLTFFKDTCVLERGHRNPLKKNPPRLPKRPGRKSTWLCESPDYIMVPTFTSSHLPSSFFTKILLGVIAPPKVFIPTTFTVFAMWSARAILGVISR